MPQVTTSPGSNSEGCCAASKVKRQGLGLVKFIGKLRDRESVQASCAQRGSMCSSVISSTLIFNQYVNPIALGALKWKCYDGDLRAILIETTALERSRCLGRVSTIAAAACLIGGSYANAHATNNPAPAPPTHNIAWSIDDHSMEHQVLGPCIDIVVTICTKAIGFVHIVSLRSMLAYEGRLNFTTNPRLARGNFGNGTIMNAIMAMLLILSYAAPSIILPRYTYEDNNGEYSL
ncbi:hypothetical protein FIBSPDRAFT_961024 [Athelia psychrophila]|uniref:Uncharacterized protein n=1 Tax=Athelia psychrophila TaxID=1759441 RepID=A0A166BNY8_9AGAM|nr:hypothetical protein FIBSPDRAFT_961024 [Fibularhizoctonia sp. CBS 109695]